MNCCVVDYTNKSNVLAYNPKSLVKCLSEIPFREMQGFLRLSRRLVQQQRHSANWTNERYLNSIKLIGRVGQDPTVYTIGKAGDVADEPKQIVTFSLATNEYKGLNENQEPIYSTDWHRIVVYNKYTQESVENYVRKGDRLHIKGRIHNNLKTDANGTDRFITSVIADQIIYLTKTI
jgi:single-strand DNA-binding protein